MNVERTEIEVFNVNFEPLKFRPLTFAFMLVVHLQQLIQSVCISLTIHKTMLNFELKSSENVERLYLISHTTLVD